MSKLFIRLLQARGLTPSFLKTNYNDLLDPFMLPDMDSAIDRLIKAIQGKERVIIYGDYDADGVTAATLMEQSLLLAGLPRDRIEIMLPNRFTDGYGMSSKLVKHARESNTNLVITVDCGSRNHDIIEKLNEQKIDTVVTDHHELGSTLPDAKAVVNPKRLDWNYSSATSLRELAGVGVAFKVAQALVKTGKIKRGQEKWLLDLVLIGTICDAMLLTGENRILTSYGMIVLEKTRRKGLKELMRLARVSNLNSESIGFQIGPRLNAAGRLEDATLSLNLLRTNSSTEAARLAAKLEELNKRRKTEQITAVKEITERGVPDNNPVIVEVGNWHEGVLGIIAGRLVEEYQRPAFVLAETEKGILKGSGRSFGDFNLAAALQSVSDTTLGGGGHAAAAGVRLHSADLDAFRSGLNSYYSSLGLKDQTHYLKPTPDLAVSDFDDFTLDFMDELKTLEPFGAGNEEPIFRLTDVELANVQRMGADGQHLRLDLRDKSGKYLKLVAFFAPDAWLSLEPGHLISPLIKLAENDYNGVKSVEGRICDL
ncbi:single-stranded-DNA-specific exonuclease RecJ [Candidatus Saccharibacteria bacterium]|nr:single-stranded-DNA-specific exonuclease RecJ [Candidatus Saccharibacteria bacterium]